MKVNLTPTFAHRAEMKMPISLSVAGDKKKGVLAGFQNTVGVCVCELWEGSILQYIETALLVLCTKSLK